MEDGSQMMEVGFIIYTFPLLPASCFKVD